MKQATHTLRKGPAPRIGFIGWGAGSRALLDNLGQVQPEVLTTAPLFMAGDAPEVPPALPLLPTVEALFSACDTIVVDALSSDAGQILPLMRLSISDRHVVVLMGQNWRLSRVLSHLNERKLVRCLVNPLRAGHNTLIAYYPTPYLSAEEVLAFRGLFAHLNTVIELASEAEFEVVLGLAGIAPATFYTVMDALADGALMMGLPRRPALTFIASILLGAAQEMLKEGSHPALLREEALQYEASAAGLMELESAGIRGLMMRTVRQAMEELRAQADPSQKSK